jgi:raffinose/stachyose/melibiose transport system permease protein
MAFRHVIFPMLRPVTGTVVILNCVFIWNDLMEGFAGGLKA